MVLTVYYDPVSSPCKSVLAFLELNKIPHEKKIISVVAQDTKSPSYKQLNPLGLVPAIDDNGVIVREHEAIIKYLIATRKESKVYLPDDFNIQLIINQFYPFFYTGLRPHTVDYFLGALGLNPTFNKEASRKQIEETVKTFDEVFLGDKKYITGDKMTIADITAGNEILNLYLATDLDFKKFPRVKTFVERILDNPVFLEVNKPVMELAKMVKSQHEKK